MVPSLHINLPSDVHLAIPPFLPEQGLLPFAITSVAIQKDKNINATVTTLRIALNRPGFLGDLTFWENIRMKNTYSPEIRQRAVRLYQEQRSEYPTQWAAMVSIASKFGCTPETLRTCIKKFDADLADNGAAANQAQIIKQQERQIKELQRANEILRKAAAFFAQAQLDRK